MSQFSLKLFVMGSSGRSLRAVDNLRKFCQEELADLYQLEIVDVLVDPAAAEREKIFATPTLIKYAPLPVKRIIGDLGDRTKLLQLLHTGDRDTSKDKQQAGKAGKV